MSLYAGNDNVVWIGPTTEAVDGSVVQDAAVSVDVAIDADDSTANQISGATDATPIVITTAAAHGLSSGNRVAIARVGGNVAANGSWQITVLSSTTFELDDSEGDGTYTGAGRVYRLLGTHGGIEAEHIGGQQGEYVATLPATIPFAAGTDYRIIARMTRGGVVVAEWELVETAEVRV